MSAAFAITVLSRSKKAACTRSRYARAAPFDGSRQRERASEITAAVDSLPDRQRTVFTMCHLAEQSTAEVSQALGLSEATVRVHLFRAVRKLRRLLAGPEAQ